MTVDIAQTGIRPGAPIWFRHDLEFPASERQADQRCEVAVIGAGYAGLAAARLLADAGRDVLVITAGGFSSSASARNSGAVSGGFGLNKGLFGGRFRGRDSVDAPTRDDLIAEANRSVEELESLIQSEAIACGYEKTGRLVAGISDRELEELSLQGAVWKQHFAGAISILDADEMAAEMGAASYAGGLRVEASARLEPAALLHGLAVAAARCGARFMTHVAVTSIHPAHGKFVCAADGREIVADQVLVATNGLGSPLVPGSARWVRPVVTCTIATESLPAEIAASILPQRRTASDILPEFSYFRMTATGERMVFGGRVPFPDSVSHDWPGMLEVRMKTLFPQLAPFSTELAWNSLIAETGDLLPHAGISEGVFYCLGCNGSGVAMMPYLGQMTARAILGETPESSAFWSLAVPDVDTPPETLLRSAATVAAATNGKLAYD